MITGKIRASSADRFVQHEKNNNVNTIAWSADLSSDSFECQKIMLSPGHSVIALPQANGICRSWTGSRKKRITSVVDCRRSSESPPHIFSSLINVDKVKPAANAYLLLNIGGTSFRFRESTIQLRCPTCRLGQFISLTHDERLQQCDGFLSASQEYFYERSGQLFNPIFDFLASGYLHRPVDICRASDLFAPCCIQENDIEDSMQDEEMCALRGRGEESNSCHNAYGDQFDGARYGDCRRRFWLFTEDPGSSKPAKIFALVSIGMVLSSVIAMILGSIPELQNASLPMKNNGNRNSTIFEEVRPNLIFELVEGACIIWFTFEYVLRFAICTQKCQFVRSPLNVIDVLTIVPFFLETALQVAGIGAHTIGEFKTMALVMRAVRVMRVARIFKLARYSSGLKSFGTTVRTSLPELSMLTLFLLTAIIFFSTLMYFAERDEPDTLFKSIPDAGWWAIVTMTTVGYGDYCPRTVFGKLIASCASISGVLVLAFPITMIVENFSRNYDSGKNSDFKVVQGRRRLAKTFA